MHSRHGSPNEAAARWLDSARRRVCHSGVPQLSLHSPVGDLTVSEEAGRIVALDWGWGRDQAATPLLRRAREQLEAYFGQALTAFDLPLAPAGTAYRQRVWAAMQRIPFGETRPYAALATTVGGSARAIGGACAANPIPILIPCHRVVGSTGEGGYSGGEGLPTKRALLAIEAGAPGSRDRPSTLPPCH
jgi:methylated-DNA-[protein]-cysteine S-methyltransferase